MFDTHTLKEGKSMKIVVIAVLAAAFASVASAQRIDQPIDVTIDHFQQNVTIEPQKRYVVLNRAKIYVDLKVCRQYLDNFQTPSVTKRTVCGAK